MAIITGFKFADKAQLNSGIITSLLATYSMFTPLLCFYVFGERPRLKFIIGMIFMIVAVVFVAYPSKSYSDDTDFDLNPKDDQLKAICFGLLAPMLISLYIVLSRYWTETYNYCCMDFTLDTFVVVALI
jgi:drug/metabolite transporter (DMT)-like permease